MSRRSNARMQPHELYKRSRSCDVTCLSFGANRKEEFPDYFFCHGCDLLEDSVLNSMLSTRRSCAGRNQKRYRCTGGHVNLAHPTTLKKAYRSNSVRSERPTSSVQSGSHNTGDKPIGADEATNMIRSDVHEWNVLSPSNTNDAGLLTPAPERMDLFSCDPRRLFTSSTSTDGFSLVSASGMEEFKSTVASTCLTCMTGSSISTKGSSTTTQHELEFQISLLTGRCLELDKKNTSLEKEVLELKTQIAHLAGNKKTALLNRKGDDDVIPELSDKDNNDEATASEKLRRQRLRVSDENAKLTQTFSILIGDFVSRADIADRRRFPECRLAKIIIDSVTAFEWTHSEVLRFASQLNSNSRMRDASRTDDECNSARELAAELLAVLRKRKQGRHRGDKSKAALLINCMWADDFLHGEAKACMIAQVRQYLRQHVFSPWKILKAMDIAGFKLSLAGIEVLRHVENDSKYGRGSLPSKSTILRSARKLEAAASEICPFTMIGRTFRPDLQYDEMEDNIVGEGFEFDAVKVTETLFQAFGLMDEAKRRPVELGLASDGAQLTNTISHVAAGLKFNDVAMRDPITKQPMLLHNPDSLVQSRNLCFPLRIVIAKDSKKTLEGFRSLYKSFDAGDVAEALKCHPFKMSFPGDMKLQWGALDEGGAAKVKEKFCYICPCRSSTIHVPQDKNKCLLCMSKVNSRQGGDGEYDIDECYHYPFFADPGVRAALNEELDVLTSLVDKENVTIPCGDDAADRPDKQRMYVRRPGELSVDGDLLDIDYQPSTTRNKAAWAALITAELSEREMSISGILEERRQRLRDILLKEQRARDLSRMLKESEPKEQAMYLVLQAVVCILHLENRVGLKSIESILRSGLSNAQKGILDWTTGGAKHRQDQYIQRISNIIGSKILGTVVAPAQWRFPLSDDGISMGTLSMDNNRTRSIMNSIELLVEESFPEQASDINRLRLLRCFPKYRAAMALLRKSTDLNDDEIMAFQCHIDGWFNDWVKVYGKEGCTNYTHMLSSSHVMKYMQEWKCLHRFSQQGWEALNALIKSYFFRRTNRGGLSRNGTQKSKLLGIARWLQRRIMWYSGRGDELFLDADVQNNRNENVGDENDYNQQDEESNSTSDDEISYNSTNDFYYASEDDDDDFSIGVTSSEINTFTSDNNELV
jgi:hypothetical protein